MTTPPSNASIPIRSAPGRGGFLGWWVLAICSIAVFISSYGLTYTVSAFVDPVLEELDISRSLLSAAYAVGTGIAGLAILLIGRRFDRWGSRRVMIWSAFGLALGLVALSLATEPWVLFIGFPLIRIFGQGAIPLATRVLVPNWFFRQRARAFSVLGLAKTASVALVPLLNIWLIGQFGWRLAWQIASVMIVVSIVPLVLLYVRNRPEDIGQYPDGAKVDADGVAPVTDAGIGFSLAEAKRTPAFWALVAAGAVPPLIMTGLHLHQAAIFVDRGTSHTVAAATFTIEAISMLVATVVVGALNDRVSSRVTLGCGLLLLALTMVMLIFAGNTSIAILYGVLRGASSGASAIAVDVAWPTYYGRKHLGSIRGFGLAASLFGSAIGPLPFGLAADLLGGYLPAIVALMFLPLAVAVAVFITRPPTLDLTPKPLASQS